MSANNSALAHITASYTDSENEDDRMIEDSPTSNSSHDSQVIIPVIQKPNPIPSAQTQKKATRLVSYHDDTVVSDDDDDNVHNPSPERIIEEKDDDKTDNSLFQQEKEASEADEISKHAHYGFSLPPEPKGKPSPELVSKIKRLYEKMDTNNMNMNKIIQERKEFRNPSIYEKLIQFCDINEFGTNYPPEMYDPLKWGPESFYEELAKSQKTEMLKRQKERKDIDKVEQATAAARKVEEEAKKRKSKWDQPAPSTTNKPGVPLTANVTGTKGTVISAFGSLPKKQ